MVLFPTFCTGWGVVGFPKKKVNPATPSNTIIAGISIAIIAPVDNPFDFDEKLELLPVIVDSLPSLKSKTNNLWFPFVVLPIAYFKSVPAKLFWPSVSKVKSLYWGVSGISSCSFLISLYSSFTSDLMHDIFLGLLLVIANNSKASGEKPYVILPLILKELGFLLKKVAKIKKGSANGSKEIVGSITTAQLREIAETKLPDLNAYDVEAAMKIVAGTAKNMGIEIK